MTLLTISADQYHRDEVADQPTLSASIAHILVTQSPAHAKAAHPRLNPAFKREDKAHFDIGTAAHAMLLEGRSVVVAVDAANWLTKAAKEARNEIRAQGKIPLLVDKLAEVEEMVAAVREQLAAHTAQPALFTDGLPEQTLVWDEDGVTCRARLDWLRNDYTACDDLKTSGRPAKVWKRRGLFDNGCDVQAAMYLRGVKAVTGHEAKWRWVIVETEPPYAVDVVEPTADLLAVGAAKVEHAIGTWRDCLASGVWPAYGSTVTYADVPPWESRWLDNEDLEALAWAQM